MIDRTILQDLKKTKNLLAFSHGLDSTALFYLLEEAKIKFDIAIVRYKVRKEAILEVRSAKNLAKKFGKKCFYTLAPNFNKNFEKNARDFRYAFFEKTMKENSYDLLLTAHQLNDKLEWFLMPLTKGAGAVELSGMKVKQNFKGIQIVRPILHVTKKELQDYLEKNNKKWFFDKTNNDEKYKRNYFRKNFSDKLLEKYANNIKKSFEYLEKDTKILIGNADLKQMGKLFILKREKTELEIRQIDKIFKTIGILLTNKQRSEISSLNSLVVSRKYALSKTQKYIFIHPYIQFDKIPKQYRERCRILKIPQKLRAYLYKNNINLQNFGSMDDFCN